MKELPDRKHNRLKGYDYSQAGYYFITICVKEGHEMLGRIVGAATCRPQIHEPCPYVILSEYGKTVDDAIEDIPKIYPFVKVDKYVIMPNHIHIILVIDCENRQYGEDSGQQDTTRCGRQVAAPTISLIVGNMKRAVSLRTGFSLWQKSFHDHIIRNESEYQRIWQYIDNNPLKWVEDYYYIKDGKEQTSKKDVSDNSYKQA